MWWPLLAVALVATSFVVAVVVADASLVLVYNETGDLLPEISVSVGSCSKRFRQFASRESICLRLAPRGDAGEISLLAGGACLWRGGYLEPRGGWRAIVRLRRDGQTEFTLTTSPWRQWLGSHDFSRP